MPHDEKLFINQDFTNLAMKMVRRLVYRKLTKIVGALDYQEQWRKLNPEQICEMCFTEVCEFKFCVELKQQIDHCSILNESEEALSVKVRNWENKLFEGKIK